MSPYIDDNKRFFEWEMSIMSKYAIPYRVEVPTGKVRITEGRLRHTIDNNIEFLKGFDLDRLLYWFRVNAGKDAPSVPYAADFGIFENYLHGQTVGEFLMGAGTTLLWQEDSTLRNMVQNIISELEEYQKPNGFILPIDESELRDREYPNYTRAWITFGLLDAGYAGEEKGFKLARGMSDYFNHSKVLPYVKDMNLGFQGILASTRMYDAPCGKMEDIEVAKKHYQETWWLQELIDCDHRAIYDHPGNHPHSTLLTTLEAYLDMYRVTGEQIYWDAVTSALKMYEDKWQHVGGGIAMCEMDKYYPGCLWLSPDHNYNELCSTNFWILINQRMRRLDPDNAHYADEIENSIYNVLLASQVGSTGFHYLNFLERSKDWRYLDRATCCAGLGTRLCGLLPQFLYAYDDAGVYVDMYACSEADLDNGISLRCETDIPDGGHVKITITKADRPFTLRLRIPRWATKDRSSYYENHENVNEGDVFEFDLPHQFNVTRYTGGERLPDVERYALERGPLLYAAMGTPSPVNVSWDVNNPEDWFAPMDGKVNKLSLKNDNRHEYWAYCDIHDEPFSVYPAVREPAKVSEDHYE